MTNQGRKISDDELVEIVGGFEQPIVGIDEKPTDRPETPDDSPLPRRGGGGSTIPVEPVGGTSGGSSGMTN